MLMQFYQVQFRAVAFVLAEAIFGKTRAEVAHNRVAGDLGDHTGGRDAEAEAVAIDDGGLRKRKRENRKPVDQNMVGLQPQGVDREPHRLVRGAQDVDRINRRGVLNGHGPANMGCASDALEKRRPKFRRKSLRIRQSVESPELEENDGGSDYGTGERSATGLVDASDKKSAPLMERAFMPK